MRTSPCLGAVLSLVLASCAPQSRGPGEPSGGGNNSSAPELPRVSVDVSLPAPSRSVNVPAGADLQAAINAAQPGDELVLAAGASYTGPFTLPNKGAATGWIVIRSNGALPAPGTRVTPANVGQLATLLSPGLNQSAVQTAPGAHHYRLIGLEIATPTTVTSGSALVSLGDGSAAQNTLSQIPHHLILDRVYIHGHSAFSFRRCIALNSGEAAIIDSWISECHGKGFDAQAIAGWNGPGPYRIENNRLEGSGENVMFGGADPSVPNLIPSDIEIRRNHIIKPMSWQGVWTAKNLLELKIGNRVLLEGNVFENSWADAQTGFAIVIWSVNQDGTCAWCGTADVTFRYNMIRNSGSGFQLTDRWNTSSLVLQRVLIAHNTATGIGASGLGGAGRMYQILGGIIDMALVHNTTVLPGSGTCLMFGSTPPVVLPGLNIQDNVLGGGTAIFSSYGLNTTAITMFSGANSSFLGNGVVGVSTTALPAGNTGISSVTGVGFVQWDTDLHLTSTSPLHGTASDKTDPGADITTLLAKTAGVVVP